MRLLFQNTLLLGLRVYVWTRKEVVSFCTSKSVFFFFFFFLAELAVPLSVGLAPMKPKIDWKSLASRHWKGSINDRRFSALFGLSVAVVEDIWSKLSFAFRTESLKPVHLLWLLYWFKCYDSDDASSAVWGVAPDTWRKHRNHALWVCHETMDEVRCLKLLQYIFCSA